ncbi:MAG TPA: redoxin domain-containing protein [Gemmataceae bacterium]|nr:redoxin domain-containing protein [Gemmataceae bacterium]
MYSIRSGTVLLVLVVSAALAAREPQDRTLTPAEQYQLLLKERDQLPDELSKAKTAEERKELRERLASLPLRFLQLAEKYPKDPVAVEALTQTVALAHGSAFPTIGPDTPGDRALALLVRDHVKSDRLGPACQHVAFGFHTSRETFLRAVLELNPHREVLGLACLSLAQFLSDRMNRLDILKDQEKPDLAERYHRVFGKDFVEELQRQDRGKVAREIEALFDRAAEKYADVKIPVTYFGSGGTVGEKARAELFQIRHLSVGKEAPDIEGEDQDGKRFKLSDYRGKVVLLDFWYHL